MSVPQSTYPITGELSPSLSLREEIDTWQQDPKNRLVVNLFILALAKFQSMDVNDKLSYYRIAGIHGDPLVTWDDDATPTKRTHYCAHARTTFPTWHRPYILLFEQRLHDIMINEIIPSFPESSHPELIAAAQTFRLPYWDWAAKKSDPDDPSLSPDYNVPRIVRDEYCEVFTGTGTTRIPNPMYAFRTKEPMGNLGKFSLNNIHDNPFDICRATSRCPPAPGPNNLHIWGSPGGVQDHVEVARNLRAHEWKPGSHTGTLGEAVYRLFSEDYFSNYAAFASTRYNHDGSLSDYLSCEGIHDNVHNWVGGYGHMGTVPVAAFDPIFWLHHCNVDRQFAIWQTLNSTSWFLPGDPDSPEDPLIPFQTDANGTHYTSNVVRDWMKLDYSYPELQPWLPKYSPEGQFDKAAYLADVRRQVNELYTSTTRGQVFALYEARPSLLIAHKDSKEHNDYIVNVLFDKFAFGGSSFTIHVFIGEHAKVGSIYSFSSPLDGGCENCRAQQASGTLSTGQLHITSQLIDDIDTDALPLTTLDPKSVEAYLKDNLRWNVTKASGNIPLGQIPSLKVSVAAGKGIQYHDNDKLSHYLDYTILHSVTAGRPGGL